MEFRRIHAHPDSPILRAWRVSCPGGIERHANRFLLRHPLTGKGVVTSASPEYEMSQLLDNTYLHLLPSPIPVLEAISGGISVLGRLVSVAVARLPAMT